jgi:hypothetical protein
VRLPDLTWPGGRQHPIAVAGTHVTVVFEAVAGSVRAATVITVTNPWQPTHKTPRRFSLTVLSKLFPSEWGTEMPRNLVELLSAEYDDLDATAKGLRAMAVDLVHSFERAPVLTARHALELLERHHLPARKGKWTAVALNASRERVYHKVPGGGMRLTHTVSTRFPDAERLDASAPLPEQGFYLFIHGGGPSALTDESYESYQTAKASRQVADLVLWDESEDTATFWSVRAGVGARGGEVIPFPDEANLRRWQQK